MTGSLSREATRKAYEKPGFDDSPLTFERMAAHRDTINSEMLAARLMQASYHMAHPSRIGVHGSNCAEVTGFYAATLSTARATITNPPNGETSSKGHGRWPRHTLTLAGCDYLALLLSRE
ncbi:hypothetical protein [Paracoccus homiensis]|uniref:Uncharacterized protein n=1 Tax=Paracoccus homiensis TaxID=364199 RepID=A0A1I0GP95_9RHOB|nr:hypothetical protein [Paracoccus homiensis]SET72785.1 hypothetical protein SAMN04489858_1092 [Paracoccus homiensis]